MIVLFFGGLVIGLIYGAGIVLWFWDRAITKAIVEATINNIKARTEISRVLADFGLMRALSK